MATAEVYYFSATGNSSTVAMRISERIGGTPISIPSVVDHDPHASGADILGVVFPVYYNDVPNIIRRFAKTVKVAHGAYIFAVATYGGAAGASLATLAEIFRTREMSLAAGFGIHMPQNAFRKPWERKPLVYRLAARRISFVARSVKSRRKGMFYSNVILQAALRPFQGWLRRQTIRHLETVSQIESPSGLTVAELIPLSDRSFSVTDACTGCGTCARVCPVHNLRIEDGKPVWKNQCETCLACYHWCPADAIRGGLAEAGYRYHHPDVTLRDMLMGGKDL